MAFFTNKWNKHIKIIYFQITLWSRGCCIESRGLKARGLEARGLEARGLVLFSTPLVEIWLLEVALTWSVGLDVYLAVSLRLGVWRPGVWRPEAWCCFYLIGRNLTSEVSLTWSVGWTWGWAPGGRGPGGCEPGGREPGGREPGGRGPGGRGLEGQGPGAISTSLVEIWL